MLHATIFTMPKVKKFRDLCRRQQNRRLSSQQSEINSPVRELKVINNIVVLHDNQELVTIESIPINENDDRESAFSLEMSETEELQLEDVVQDSYIIRNECNQKKTLQEQLHTWAIEHNVTQKSLTALLHILHEQGHNELPKDARILLHTPKHTAIRECAGGHLFYYGLQKALMEKLDRCIWNINTELLNINTLILMVYHSPKVLKVNYGRYLANSIIRILETLF